MKTFSSALEMITWLIDNETQILRDHYGRKWVYKNFKFWFSDLNKTEFLEGVSCLHLFSTIDIPNSVSDHIGDYLFRKLKNVKEDKEILRKLIKENHSVLAEVSIGVFTSNLASSLKIITYRGKVFSIDKESGYCSWTSEHGTEEMPAVNINCITLL